MDKEWENIWPFKRWKRMKGLENSEGIEQDGSEN